MPPLQAWRAFYERHRKFVPAATFLAGTVYDVLTLDRIDRWHAMAILGTYLVIVGTLLTLEILNTHRPLTVPPRLAKVWHHREEVIHFFLGNLLSAFTVLYFKSASLLSSLLFFMIIAGLLIGNEFSALRRLGLVLRTVMFAVCLTSYLACVTPVWWGRIGALPFLTSVAAAAALFALLLLGLRRRVDDRTLLLKRVALPFGATLAVFLAAYALRIIPPVPLSLTRIGIFHGVERIKGGYRLTSTRPAWKFWQHGDQSFTARPGDRLYCFFSVFSPTGFHDNVRVHWLRKDDREGWQSADAVAVAIAGGREEGYRGFAYKAAYRPGEWQVRIETSDGREIGRLYLTVEAAPADQAPAVARTEDI